MLSHQKTAQRRNQAIEILRVLAAYGIVAYHSGAPFKNVAYSGLTAFLILSPYLDLALSWDRPRKPMLLAKTFLAPWLFWWLFYGVRNIVVNHKTFFLGMGWFQGVLSGTSGHLWFMPAMFAVLLALNACKGRIPPALLFWVSVILGSASLASSMVWMPITRDMLPPLAQWAQAAPAVLIGMALGMGNKVSRPAQMLGAATLALSLAVAAASSLPDISISYPIGVAATLIAIVAGRYGVGANWNVRPISACMLGAYLGHMFVLQIVVKATGPANYIAVTVTFLIATAAVWIAQRMLPWTHLIVGAPPQKG
jgi:hypothetical protein